MTGRIVTLVCSLTLVAFICCSCSSGGSTPPAVAPIDKSAMKQTGQGGVKAAGGGGVAGYPVDAKPGEKVGPPPSGSKAGGG
jgi:hypothetical protein